MALDETDYMKIKQDIIDSFVNETKPKKYFAPREEDGDRSCELCGKSFTFINRLVAHLRDDHGIERPFKCPHCEKAYPQRFMLNAHVKRRHGAYHVVACAHCTFSTLDREKLERHIRSIHDHELSIDIAENQDDFHYLEEDEVTNYLQELEYHISNKTTLTPSKRRRGRPRSGRSARPERTYLCSHCGKELKTFKGLQIHTRLHTGERPYACQICGKGFSCETLLRTHRVTHTGERPFTCDLCDKSFTQRSTLIVHKRYHSGERPYVCDRCSKGFVTRTLLNTHRKVCR